MIRIHPQFLYLTIAALTCGAAFSARADAPAGTVGAIAPRPLIDFSDSAASAKFVPSGAEVSVAPSTSPAGVVITVQPSTTKYPGVTLKPDQGAWDLSPFGRIEVAITNLGGKPMTFGLRVDGSSWQDSSGAITRIKPGETGIAKVYFGYNYGQKSTALKTTALSELLIVAPPAKDAAESFRVESIQAAGSPGEGPPVDPSSTRIRPPNGVLLGAGAKPLDPAKNLMQKGGVTETLVVAGGAQNLKLTFPGGNDAAAAGIKPEEGKWALIDGNEVHARVRNDGSAPMTPKIHIDSNGGSIEATAAAPLAPGAETDLVVSYINPTVWKNTPPAITPDPGTGNNFASSQVSDVLFSAAGDGAQTLTVESLGTGVPPVSIPDWLGKRPPVEGDWTKTLDDEFNGPAIDTKTWNVTGPNYYDQRSHFTKDELVFSGNLLKMKYEKKTGFQNDDPTKKQTDYAVGYLDSFGKWTQRYGYWEARMKLPTAPGLWPAFWLMPDRGEGAQHRNSTMFGGMEFDIMEFLSGWGIYRYNIAMHWDGYGKDHKATGSTMNYVQPDQDGFVTTGLLWTPGSAIYYCNGKEILDYENERVSNVESSILFSMVSGGWDNQPLDDAKLPDALVIDYVRVWQRKDLATPADGSKTPTGPIPDH
jgi:beta-glucanase (GH16 family)